MTICHLGVLRFFLQFKVTRRQSQGLDRSFADYLEGSDSVIVKGNLKVNFDFW